MRKLTAIFLILIFLFNLIGYKIAFYFIQKHQDIQLEAELDKGSYSENELVSIQLPLMNDYQNESEYERYDGEISYNGIIYSYVKRRIHNGNLELLCILNHQKTIIELKKTALVSNTENNNTPTKNQNTLKVHFEPGEFVISNSNILKGPAVLDLKKNKFCSSYFKILQPLLDFPIDPPDVA